MGDEFMVLTKKQLQLISSSPALRELKDWFIAVDTMVNVGPINKKYYFKSYGDANGNTEWGIGAVKTNGINDNGYSQVKVISNSTDESFIGQKFYIASDAKTDGTIYQLYTDAGSTSAGIYVEISTEVFEEEVEEN